MSALDFLLWVVGGAILLGVAINLAIIILAVVAAVWKARQ